MCDFILVVTAVSVKRNLGVMCTFKKKKLSFTRKQFGVTFNIIGELFTLISVV